MSAENFTLSGTEALMKIFREYPEMGYRRPIVNAFRKAGLPVKKKMSESLPSNLSFLKRTMRIVTYKGKDPVVGVGVFGKGLTFKNSRGIAWNPWQLALWFNYGTLDWRAERFHQFKTPVRRKSKTNRMAGIRPGLFIEEGWDRSKIEAQKIFEKTVDDEVTKFLQKNAIN